MNDNLLKKLLENISAKELLEMLEEATTISEEDNEEEICVKKRRYNGRTNWTEVEKRFVRLWFWSTDEDYPRRGKRPKGAEIARLLGRPYESIKTYLNRYMDELNDYDVELEGNSEDSDDEKED